ncbi:MAG: calcium-binding protein [Nitratireductor sp.]
MPNFDGTNTNQAIPFYFPENQLNGVAVISGDPTEFIWLTNGGHRIVATGSFVYNPGLVVPTSGTVTAISIALSNYTNLDIAITSIPDISINTFLTIGNDFWSTLFSGADHFSGTYGHAVQLLGDDPQPANGDSGAADIFNLTLNGTGQSVISGDFGSIPSFSEGVSGGNDTINIFGAGTGEVVVYGDGGTGDFVSSVTGGNDTISAFFSSATTGIVADVAAFSGTLLTAGADTVHGSNQVDYIYGDTITIYSGGTAAAGVDTLYGFGGDDFIYGDAKQVFGSLTAAADTIFGGDGADTIYGDAEFFEDFIQTKTPFINPISTDPSHFFAGADDLIFGGAGADVIYGDVFMVITEANNQGGSPFGASGNSAPAGGTFNFGSDTIYGGDDGDTIYGDYSSILDPRYANSGAADYLFGDSGNDEIHGNGGDDWIYGGGDNDTLYGDSGADLIYGDAGVDTLNGGDGNDFMWGGTEGDTLNGDSGDDWMEGEDGADTLNGGDDNDTLFGGNGMDTISGDSGADSLFGGAGADVINGGTENDLMWGDMPGTFDSAADIFEFDAGWGFDAVYDFELGVDQVRFTSIAGLTQFSNLTLIDGGANVTVAFGSDAITFYGVTQAELEANQGDFGFVP